MLSDQRSYPTHSLVFLFPPALSFLINACRAGLLVTRPRIPSHQAPLILKPVALGPGVTACLPPARGASQRPLNPREGAGVFVLAPTRALRGVPGWISESSTKSVFSNQPKPTPNFTAVGCYHFSCKTREAAPRLAKGNASSHLAGSALQRS